MSTPSAEIVVQVMKRALEKYADAMVRQEKTKLTSIKSYYMDVAPCDVMEAFENKVAELADAPDLG